MLGLQGDVRQGASQKRSPSMCHAAVRTTSLPKWTYQHIITSLDSIVLVVHGAWLDSAAKSVSVKSEN